MMIAVGHTLCKPAFISIYVAYCMGHCALYAALNTVNSTQGIAVAFAAFLLDFRYYILKLSPKSASED